MGPDRMLRMQRRWRRSDELPAPPMRLHPLDPSVKCLHCGTGFLQFARTRRGRDVYRCVGEAHCKGYMLHYRRGKSCGVAPELNYGLIGTWVECAGPELAKEA